MSNTYLGAVRIVVGADAAPRPDPVLVVRVRNVPEVVRKKGGGLADLAQTIAPETVKQRFWSEMRQQMADQFRQEGVDAEVALVDASGAPTAPFVAKPSLWRDFAFGVATGLASAWLGSKLL